MLSVALRKISFFGIPASVAQMSSKIILTLTFKKQKRLWISDQQHLFEEDLLHIKEGCFFHKIFG